MNNLITEIKDETEGVPFIHNTNQLKHYLKDLYVIEDYFSPVLTDADPKPGNKKYKKFLDDLMNTMKGCFHIAACREYPVNFKFYQDSDKIFTLQFRHFCTNTILWYSFCEMPENPHLDESFIIHPEDTPNLTTYENTKLIPEMEEFRVKTVKRNKALSETQFRIRNISNDFSLIMGLDVGLKDYIDLYLKYPEIKELMESTFAKDLQPVDIEKKLNFMEKKYSEIVMNDPDSPLGVLLRAKSGTKGKQLREFTGAGGLKPTIDGITIPICVENSILIGGSNTPTYHYIDAGGARKSLVLNKKSMGNAGFFGKMVSQLARTLSLSRTVSDCGSTHLVEYTINSDKDLKKLNGKFYKLTDDDFDYEVLNSDKDKHLIGKKIKARSIATCACKNPNEFCPKCAGLSVTINRDIADGIGCYSSEENMKDLEQKILSSKHLLNTISEAIELCDNFSKFFRLLSGEVYPTVNNNNDIADIEDYAIYIDPVDVKKEDELDDDMIRNTVIEHGRFVIRNMAAEEIVDIPIDINGGREIMISDDAMEMMRKHKGYIYFKDIDDDTKLFEIDIRNNELTKPLEDIMKLLKTKDRGGYDDTSIDAMCQALLSLNVESGIPVPAMASEIIINRLIRSASDIYKRPDFSQEELEDYVILIIPKALEANAAPLLGLSSQQLKRQILSNDLIEKRHDTSYVDPFFMETQKTDNFKKYSQIMLEGKDDEDESYLED